MMMELPMTSKNDELQIKWKACISIVCKYASCKESFERLYIELKNVFSSIAESLQQVFSTLCELARDLVGITSIKKKPVLKKLSTSYPHVVDNFKVNTKGYPRPPMRCARSRCV